MKNKIIQLLFLFSPFVFLYAQPDLSGKVVFPDSVGIDLIRVEVWQNNQQIANTITDSLGYFEIDSIITGVNNVSNPLPSSFELYPNYPSPFDKTTNIIYELNEPEEISITIYNSIGQEITTLTSGYRQKGFYIAQWDGRNNFGNEVAQGIYFARLDNGKDARFIKLLKMNGALNASGITIPGSFYRTYKGSNINQDYLVKFIDFNIVNRVDYAEITIHLPAVIHQVLTEEFTYTGPSQIAGVEGEQVAIVKSWFNYGTQLDSIKLLNSNVWSLTNSTSDSLYFATIDTTLNGQIPLELKTTALHGTVDTTVIQTNLADVVYWQGQFVDDMKYKKLLGIVEPGAGLRAEIKVNNQSYFTDNDGYFNFQLTPTSTYTVKVQGIEDNGDTTTYQHTFQLAGVDQTDLIFHAMPFYQFFQMDLNPQDGYDFAWEGNFRPVSGANYSGKKQQNWNISEHGIYQWNQYALQYPDTMTIAEMQYLNSVIADTFNAIQQLPIDIVLHPLPDTAYVFEYDGEIYWFVDRWGAPGQYAVEDIDLDGYFDRAIATAREMNPAFNAAILQEGASVIFGPGEVVNPRLGGKTIISEMGNPGYITPIDKWLLRIVENYEPLDDIDDILGF